ncbi:MAG TPA: 3-hydroxyacyl-CoA dehydrogenase family protein [Kofleriaceae bacterium]|nr:3-hydroxyacyl-CoA dehydrogenase family protein [Kofleriaceae bacterium]
MQSGELPVSTWIVASSGSGAGAVGMSAMESKHTFTYEPKHRFASGGGFSPPPPSSLLWPPGSWNPQAGSSARNAIHSLMWRTVHRGSAPIEYPGAVTLPTLEQIRTVAVLGAGTMGHGIAHVVALAGARVHLYDAMRGAAQAGIAKIARNLDKGVELGKVQAVDRDAAIARVEAFDELAPACAHVDCVIEAVPEHLELKRELFSDIDRIGPSHALLATNTSSLPIGEISTSLRDPSRFVGMHFFNPVHVMKLVEVVHHARSAPAAVALAVALAEKLGKSPIVVADSPGFASSRLGIALGLEAMRMVEQKVASAADIDTAMKLGYGHPMGPLELTDLVGLDVRLGIAEYLCEAIGKEFTPPRILRDKVAGGKLGKKTGEGFYQWSPDGKRR